MTTRTRSRRAPDRGTPRVPERDTVKEGIVTAALEDMKAVNVKMMDVRGLTDIADVMVIASGNSDRHVRSIADRVVEKAKEAGLRPLGVEGEREGEWVLVDLHDIVRARHAAARARVLRSRAHVGMDRSAVANRRGRSAALRAAAQAAPRARHTPRSQRLARPPHRSRHAHARAGCAKPSMTT